MKLQDLPEECLSHILSLTSPRDVIRSSAVSKQFLSASEYDTVWIKFLPSDYDHFISQSCTPLDQQQFSSKKELFFYLCRNPVLFNNNTQSFALDKWSGKKCYMLGARALTIVWGETPEYWSWKSIPESRFPEIAELLDVCWLEIKGRIYTHFLSSNTTYDAYFVFKKNDNHFYGFRQAPIEVSVYELNEEGSPKEDQRVIVNHFYLTEPSLRRSEELPVERNDGWMEMDMGRYHVGTGVEDADQRVVLEMSPMDVIDPDWKSGLIVQGIELRPLD